MGDQNKPPSDENWPTALMPSMDDLMQEGMSDLFFQINSLGRKLEKPWQIAILKNRDLDSLAADVNAFCLTLREEHAIGLVTAYRCNKESSDDGFLVQVNYRLTGETNA